MDSGELDCLTRSRQQSHSNKNKRANDLAVVEEPILPEFDVAKGGSKVRETSCMRRYSANHSAERCFFVSSMMTHRWNI